MRRRAESRPQIAARVALELCEQHGWGPDRITYATRVAQIMLGLERRPPRHRNADVDRAVRQRLIAEGHHLL